MKKMILINASPRKKGNTAQMLHAAEDAAREAGAETEFVNLYDLNYTGCRSCLACKVKDGERCKCFWKDDLSPLLDRIFAADCVIFGSPVYLGQPTAQFRALLERMVFCALSYDDYSCYYKGRLNVGMIYTMNAPQEFYEHSMLHRFAELEGTFRMFNGTVASVTSCDTLQVSDYSKFAMRGFDPKHKKLHHDEQFPRDLENARALAKQLL